MPTLADFRRIFDELRPGDLVEVVHEVKVGSSATWKTKTTGTVVNTERRRQGLHFRRALDDKVFADSIILRRPDGEETTVTMDEFTELKRLN